MATNTKVRVVVAVVSLVIAATVDVTATISRRKFDLKVYAGAIQYWWHGGALYDYVRPGSHYGFTYPPFAAVLMSPMAGLGWRAIVVVQACLTAAVAVGVVNWLMTTAVARHGWPVWLRVPVGLAALVALVPVRDVIGYGQVNILLLGLVVADVGWCVARGSRFAGVGIGIATAIKLVPGLFVIYLLLTGRRRAAATAAGTFLVANTAAAALAPADSVDFWLRSCWEIGRIGDPMSNYNQSLRGGLLRLGLESSSLWLVGCLVVLAAWAWGVRRLPAGADRTGVALTGVAACIVSPITWVHHLVWVVPALAVVVETGALALAGIAGLVLASRITTDGNDGWLTRTVLVSSCLWLCVVLLAFLVRTAGGSTERQRSRPGNGDGEVGGGCQRPAASVGSPLRLFPARGESVERVT